MVIFGESIIIQIQTVKEGIDTFCKSFGAKLSISKTKIYFSKNTCSAMKTEISRIFGFEKVTNLRKYLSTLIIHSRITCSTFNFILEKCAFA